MGHRSTAGRRVRVAALVLGPLLGGLLVGCADDADPGPGAAESSSASASQEPSSPPGEVVGEATRNPGLPGWEPVEGLYVPRDDFGAAVVGREVWTMGGMSGERGNRLTSVEVLDTSSGRWRTEETQLPVGVASFESVAVGHRIYAFGGFDEDSRPTGFSAVLDTRTGRWRDLPALPSPRFAHTVTASGGRFYVIGGRDDRGTVATVDVFDPRSETWSRTAPMPRTRDSHRTVATPEGLMVIGGWRGYGPTDAVDLYDPRTDSWSRGPAVPEPVSRAGAVVADGKVWVSYHELSYVLDLRTGRWQEANALPLYRHGFGLVRVRGSLYAIGGCALNPLRDVRDVDRLDLGSV